MAFVELGNTEGEGAGGSESGDRGPSFRPAETGAAGAGAGTQ